MPTGPGPSPRLPRNLPLHPGPTVGAQNGPGPGSGPRPGPCALESGTWVLLLPTLEMRGAACQAEGNKSGRKSTRPSCATLCLRQAKKEMTLKFGDCVRDRGERGVVMHVDPLFMRVDSGSYVLLSDHPEKIGKQPGAQPAGVGVTQRICDYHAQLAPRPTGSSE